MWWVWFLAVLAVLLLVTLLLTRGKPGPNHSELKEHRRGQSGGGAGETGGALN